MTRSSFLILLFFLCACTQVEKSKSSKREPAKEIIADTAIKEYRLAARFNSFDTMVEVLFMDTNDSISETQKKNYDGFVANQDRLTPEILNKIFEFYKRSYSDYKKGWQTRGGLSDKELEKYLPIPTTSEDLKSFISPAIVRIQNKQDCKEGTIGIEFDCTWDIENGLGVIIKNWKVEEASVGEIAYF